MVHLDSNSNAIWYSVLDPNYIRPSYELYIFTPSASVDEHGIQTVRAAGGVYARGTDPVATNVTLRLRRDIEFAPDMNLTEVNKYWIQCGP